MSETWVGFEWGGAPPDPRVTWLLTTKCSRLYFTNLKQNRLGRLIDGEQMTASVGADGGGGTEQERRKGSWAWTTGR